MPQDFTWISTVEEVRGFRAALEAQGQKLVFTNGVFDLLHVGHVRYLRQAKELGHALVVALNADASVRALKGPTRPINNQEDRAEVLRALSSVDAVVLCEEMRVTKLIEAIKPHIYAKGGDYTVESLNPSERAALKRGRRRDSHPAVGGRTLDHGEVAKAGRREKARRGTPTLQESPVLCALVFWAAVAAAILRRSSRPSAAANCMPKCVWSFPM